MKAESYKFTMYKNMRGDKKIIRILKKRSGKLTKAEQNLLEEIRDKVEKEKKKLTHPPNKL